MHPSSVCSTSIFNFRSEKDLLPVAFHTGLAMLLGNQAGSHPCEGFGAFHQSAAMAFDLHKAPPSITSTTLPNRFLSLAAIAQCHCFRLCQTKLLEGGSYLAGPNILKFPQPLFAKLSSYVSAATVEASHPHGHHALLYLLQRNIRTSVMCLATQTSIIILPRLKCGIQEDREETRASILLIEGLSDRHGRHCRRGGYDRFSRYGRYGRYRRYDRPTEGCLRYA